ncbi:retrovirus-related Pol polyprotein from transposon TNT 1-94, partial [Trifolium medium]|nr:retrovirus-related Pol polyprotein from transposon TNT 1-94 [Trifolium medium]
KSTREKQKVRHKLKVLLTGATETRNLSNVGLTLQSTPTPSVHLLAFIEPQRFMAFPQATNASVPLPMAAPSLVLGFSSGNNSFTAISEKLDTQNYLLWCQQVEPVIKAHKLHYHLVNPNIPPKYLSIEDHNLNRVNPEFEAWEVKDHTLLSWIQSTMTKEMLTSVIGSKQAWQIWDKIHAYFQTHTNAKAMQLRSELRSTSLENGTISEFLLRIQVLIDSLYAIGEPISPKEHLDVILEGLPQEYESTISLISGRFGSISIVEVKTLLLGHESRLERFRKKSTPSINFAASQTVVPVKPPPSAPIDVIESDSSHTGENSLAASYV